MMVGQIPWLRRAELRIFVGDMLYKVFQSDGKRDTVGISFNISKTKVGQPNQSTIVLANVSNDTKSFLMSTVNLRERISVELFVGYENEQMTLLARGDLVKMWPERSGILNTFTLYLLDGLGAMLNSHIEKQYSPGTPVRILVLDLARALKNGVVVDESKIHVSGTIGQRGFTACGKTNIVLDSLSRSYAFTWSIQDGVFQAYNDAKKNTATGQVKNQSSQSVYNVSLKQRNLFKATPEIGENYMQQVGMKIEALLNPKCRCDDLINLESEVYPSYNGLYTIHNITFVGDTKGTDWRMEIDSKDIKGSVGRKLKGV